MLALTLAVGLVAQSVRAANMGAKMGMGTTMVNMDGNMGMPAVGSMSMCHQCHECKSDGCKGDGCLSLGSCAACCGTNVAALPVLTAVVEMLLAERPARITAPLGVGWAAPPDPYPPRPSVLT